MRFSKSKILMSVTTILLLIGCAGKGDSGSPALTDFPVFPWPPPKPSAFVVVPYEMIRREANPTLGHVAQLLETALSTSGYVEKSYYYVPSGFAIATRLEQINEDATPKSDASRWSTALESNRVFSLASYIRALFSSNPGYFRVIVFIVGPPFGFSDEEVSREDALLWSRQGFVGLPASVRRLSFTDRQAISALIYEFEQATADHDAVLKDPSRHTGLIHLEKSGLWKAIRGE